MKKRTKEGRGKMKIFHVDEAMENREEKRNRLKNVRKIIRKQ